MSELVRIIESSGLPIAKADALVKAFAPLVEEAGVLVAKSETITVTDPTQVSAMKAARECRLALRKVRTQAESARKELKADVLATGKAIDGANKWLVERIEPAETRMQEAEEFAARIEARRREETKAARIALLAPFAVDVSFYDLAAMPEPTFAQLFESTKLAHQAKIDAERKAEEERLAAIEAKRVEDERIRAENKRLAEENARIERERQEAERLARQEREAAEAKAAAERREIEAQARREREAAEATARAEREKADAEIRKEREAREAIERKVREEAAAAERKAKAEAAAAAKAARAPDRDKLLAFAETVRTLALPECGTNEGRNAILLIERDIYALAARIEAIAGGL